MTTVLVGAYERDNFGDLLFLEITSALLGEANVSVAAPFGSHGSYSPLDFQVRRLSDAVASPTTQAVWCVGGEIGGTSLTAAYQMAAEEESFASYALMTRRSRGDFLQKLSGRSRYSSPYLPRMSASPDSMALPLIVNSAGLSGLARLVGHRSDEAWASIIEADFVSVRDSLSSAVLERRGVAHHLAPDLVHSLRTFRPEWMVKPDRERPLALVQIKGATLRDLGVAEFARALADAKSLQGFDLTLFVAGAARGHDSVPLYHEVISAMKLLDPSRVVNLLLDGSPMEKAGAIAQADLWIGTSLHGLIVSSSFEVPRVGLVLDKLVRYSETWNEPMPMGVKLADLDRAVLNALRTTEGASRAELLAAQALESFSSAQSVVDRGLLPPAQVEERRVAAKRLDRRARSRARTALTVAVEFRRERRRQ